MTVQVDQLTNEKKKNEKDLEEMDKMINDLNAEVDMAQKQLDTANDDKDCNEAMKQKYQDELMSVRSELDQEKKDHAKTQLIKGKYKKDIAEITVRAETLEKNMGTNTELDEKQDKCDKLEDNMSEMKTELRQHLKTVEKHL
ncbi:hypothetical protein EIN_040700 [Entamoeba invadens IP1]|uniref:Uncharacterized protein n=1 Tax=Entamoeba invadens IP1 TaxID=370355 RepID=A0A0A1U1T8_ENTIV|nr:hypothetical protein EIN_040700 [Entamoeba invadens IP1]ELP85486.1 hypothetical protein EIN_040700 [Entamoeba invadens IP1]|eukprot:XP_004184832.1 hypothetical protein EIN_040700 [Entamoeba invadens IP1]